MRKVYASLCLAFGAASIASPSGLTLIPIADILKHLEANVVFGATGTERNVDKGYSYSLSGAVGLYDRIEIGVGTDLMGQTAADLELQLFESPPQAPGCALSVGLKGCRGGYREPFVAGRYDLKGLRLHGGYWNTCGEGRGFLATDFPIPGGGTGSVETLFGRHGITWASVSYPINQAPGLSILIGAGLPADRADGIQHTVVLTYGFKF